MKISRQSFEANETATRSSFDEGSYTNATQGTHMMFDSVDHFRRAEAARKDGDHDREIAVLTELLNACDQRNVPACGRAEVLRWLGNAYQSKHQLLRAHDCRLAAANIVATTSEDCSEYTVMAVRGDLGRSFIELKEWEDAERETRAALAIADSLGPEGASGRCLFRLNLALILEGKEAANEAAGLLEQVLLDAVALEEPHHILALAHVNLASIHLHAERLDRCDIHAQAASVHGRLSGDKSLVALGTKLLGQSHLRAWRRTGIEDHGASAAQLLRQALAHATDSGDFAGVADTELELARLAGKSDDESGLVHLEFAIEALEKSREMLAHSDWSQTYFSTWEETYDNVVDFQVLRRRPEAAFLTSERSRNRLLLARLGDGEPNSRLWSLEQQSTFRGILDDYSSAVIAACRSELTSSRARRGRRTFGLGAHAGRDSSADPHAVVEARQAYLQLQTKQRLYTTPWTDRRLVGQPHTSGDVQQCLGPDDAMVMYHVSESSLVAFVLTRDDFHAERLICSKDRLSETVQRCCNLIALLEDASLARLDNPILRREWWSRRPGQAHPEDIEQPLRRLLDALGELYSALVRPVLRFANLWRNWLIVPHGPLHRVPWAALWSGERYLVESHNVALLPSASFAVALSRQAPSRDGSDVLLVGAPDPSSDVLGLPGAAAELQVTRDALGVSEFPRLGIDATKQYFVERAPDASLIHVAAHHFFDALAPGLSFLKLAGSDGAGCLHACEVAEMRLGANLAVLSACDTARSYVGTGDEQYGMVRSFLAAGVRSVVSTLWAVEDESAATLFRLFHENSPNVALIEALADAQRRLMECPPYDLPYFWAPYVLSGAWDEPLRVRRNSS